VQGVSSVEVTRYPPSISQHHAEVHNGKVAFGNAGRRQASLFADSPTQHRSRIAGRARHHCVGFQPKRPL